jgi:predicted HTH transcriptional regulator
MALFHKTLSRITEQDLLALISDKEPEGKTLDYKEMSVGRTDRERKEFLYDISSFANAGGGHLLFGMSEVGGEPKDLLGLSGIDADQELLRMEQMARDELDLRLQESRQFQLPYQTVVLRS